MNTNQKRLTILTQSEIQDYFGIPRFILEERECYFTLSEKDIMAMQKSWSIHSKVNFILMLGYFKSRRMFFNYKLEDASTDITYILANYFPDYSVTHIKISGKTTRIQQQKLICRHLNYQRYDSVMAAKLSELPTLDRLCFYETKQTSQGNKDLISSQPKRFNSLVFG